MWVNKMEKTSHRQLLKVFSVKGIHAKGFYKCDQWSVEPFQIGNNKMTF